MRRAVGPIAHRDRTQTQQAGIAGKAGGRAWRGHVARWRCELLNAQALGLGRAVRLDAALAGEDCAGRMPCMRNMLHIKRNGKRAADAACGRVQGCALAEQAASGWPYCTSGWDTDSTGGYCGQGRRAGVALRSCCEMGAASCAGALPVTGGAPRRCVGRGGLRRTYAMHAQYIAHYAKRQACC